MKEANLLLYVLYTAFLVSWSLVIYTLATHNIIQFYITITIFIIISIVLWCIWSINKYYNRIKGMANVV